MLSYTYLTCGREINYRVLLQNHVKVHNNAVIDRALQEISGKLSYNKQLEEEEKLSYDEQLEEEKKFSYEEQFEEEELSYNK
ncbi:11947_t:CDS:2 [Funneliformis caledonium]|uniref:11947_t:CDS:1 n=1 Tax=Funneliformis caledonium TaxID=1117310 RepID=A0A9N9I2Q8_9GLOM|nr:11947_t:CDS:2 [Funneliformis caledonium]